MKFLEEFKKFALRGNVIDMAVGIIIGAAFGKLVSTLVDNILTPPLGLLIGGVDFSHLRIVLKGGAEEVSINYGVFIQACVNFLIVAIALFVLVKLMHSFYKTSPPSPSDEVLLLREIRDELKK